MVKTWIELETRLGLVILATVAWHLLGVQVEKIEPAISSLNRKPRVGWVRVRILKPYAIPIMDVERTLAIACRAVEAAEEVGMYAEKD